MIMRVPERRPAGVAAEQVLVVIVSKGVRVRLPTHHLAALWAPARASGGISSQRQSGKPVHCETPRPLSSRDASSPNSFISLHCRTVTDNKRRQDTPGQAPVVDGREATGWGMSENEKRPLPAEQEPDETLTVDPPEASPAPPDEEPPSRPDGYGSGV